MARKRDEKATYVELSHPTDETGMTYLGMLGMPSYGVVLNIRHGHGASTVVRDWESQSHGEGKQAINVNDQRGMRNAEG